MTFRANEMVVLSVRRAVLAALVAVGAAAAACEEKKEVVVAPAPAPKPEAPKPISVADLDMDPRVQFPAESLPTDRDLGQSVASLATAIVRGDADALRDSLDASSAALLSALVESGQWEATTKTIEAVRVVALESGAGAAKVGLGVQDKDGAYLLAWQGAQQGSRWMFTGLAVEPRTAARVSELDGVALAERAVPDPLPDAPIVTPVDPRAEENSKDRRRDRSSSRSGGSSPRPGRPGPSLPEGPGGF